MNYVKVLLRLRQQFDSPDEGLEQLRPWSEHARL